MKSIVLRSAAVVMAMALNVPFATAGPQPPGKTRQAAKLEKTERKAFKQATKSARKSNDDAIVLDRNRHVRIIRDYQRSGELPPGLAKRESLPPGLRRQLRERGQLPPGLQKRLVPIPYSLESRLPDVPGYYDRYFAGEDLVVVDSRTNRIAAIIRDVLR